MSVFQVLVLSSVVGAVVGVLAILVAVRERSRGSGWWVVPGTFGVLLIILSIARLVWAA